jgi:hypothetical protein
LAWLRWLWPWVRSFCEIDAIAVRLITNGPCSLIAIVSSLVNRKRPGEPSVCRLNFDRLSLQTCGSWDQLTAPPCTEEAAMQTTKKKLTRVISTPPG